MPPSSLHNVSIVVCVRIIPQNFIIVKSRYCLNRKHKLKSPYRTYTFRRRGIMTRSIVYPWDTWDRSTEEGRKLWRAYNSRRISILHFALGFAAWFTCVFVPMLVADGVSHLLGLLGITFPMIVSLANWPWILLGCLWSVIFIALVSNQMKYLQVLPLIQLLLFYAIFYPSFALMSFGTAPILAGTMTLQFLVAFMVPAVPFFYYWSHRKHSTETKTP